jgi:hypothetical protein
MALSSRLAALLASRAVDMRSVPAAVPVRQAATAGAVG